MDIEPSFETLEGRLRLPENKNSLVTCKKSIINVANKTNHLKEIYNETLEDLRSPKTKLNLKYIDQEITLEERLRHSKNKHNTNKKITNSAQSTKITSVVNRTKKIGPVTCLICKKQIIAMRHHLTDAHHLQAIIKRFLLDYHRTLPVKVPVFQCQQCLIRLCNPWRHERDHEIIRIKDKRNTKLFPTIVQNCIARETDNEATKKAKATKYDEYIKSGGHEGLGDATKKFILTTMKETTNMREPQKLKALVRNYKQLNSYKAKSVLNYLAKLTKFVRYCSLYEYQLMRKREHQWDAAIKEVREDYSKSAAKEQPITSHELFKKVDD